MLPQILWAVGVHLDTQSVRVREVERFAYKVIRHSNADPSAGDMFGESSERRAVGQQDSEVIEPERPLARRTLYSRLGMEPHERAVAADGTQSSSLFRPLQYLQSKHIAVIVDR